MKIFAISAANLQLLDAEFDGQIGDALALVAHAGNDPELRTERYRPDPSRPSSWTLIVAGDRIERRFPADESVVAITIAVHVYLADITDEIKSDVAAKIQDIELLSSFDDHLPWSRRPPREPSWH